MSKRLHRLCYSTQKWWSWGGSGLSLVSSVIETLTCSVASWRNWLNWFWCFHQRLTVECSYKETGLIFSCEKKFYPSSSTEGLHKDCNIPHCYTFITLPSVWGGWSSAPCDLVDALVARQHSQNSMAAIHDLAAQIKVGLLGLSEDTQRCRVCAQSPSLSASAAPVLGFFAQNCSTWRKKRPCCWRLLAVILFSSKRAFVLFSFRNVRKYYFSLLSWSWKEQA